MSVGGFPEALNSEREQSTTVYGKGTLLGRSRLPWRVSGLYGFSEFKTFPKDFQNVCLCEFFNCE